MLGSVNDLLIAAPSAIMRHVIGFALATVAAASEVAPPSSPAFTQKIDWSLLG